MTASDSLQNKKCLVFGADGYIGRHLVHYLLQSGSTVTAFGRAPDSQLKEINYRAVDIAERSSFDGIDWNVNAVFMFAGLTGTHEGFQRAEQFVRVNEIGLLNILESIRASGFRPRLVFPSTRLVYQGKDAALREDDTCDPKTIYAVNKLACEQLLRVYSNSFDIDHTIYRICVPYGNVIGCEYSFGTVGAFIQQAATNKVIRIYGDGSLRRSYTHIEDLCNQILHSCWASSTRNQILNTLGEDVSLGRVGGVIAKKYGAMLKFIRFPDKDLKIESGHTVFDASKLLGLFDVRLKQNIADWIDNIALTTSVSKHLAARELTPLLRQKGNEDE
jgi:UDP-glucose 4-epimerase